jgi:DNA polymerase III subunit beta
VRFRVEHDAFASAVGWAARVLPMRPAVPVLAGLRLRAGEAGVGLSCFDYEVSAQSAVEAVVEEQGEVLVSGRLLAEIVRSLPQRPLELAEEGARVRLSCGSVSYTLPTLPLEDFPALPPTPPEAGSVAADVFAHAVRQLAPAAGRDDTLPMLTGIHIGFAGDELRMASSDRYRIAVRDLWWQPEQDAGESVALVPARTLVEVARSLTPGTNVYLGLPQEAERAGTGILGVANAGRTTTTRLIDGEFPRYAHRFPRDFAARAVMTVAPTVEAVKRVALVAERNAPITLSFTADHVMLQAGSGNQAHAQEVLEVAYEGEDMTIAFSPQFLLDGMGAVDAPEACLSLVAPHKPAVISAPVQQEGVTPDFRYLVMPLRIA